MSDAIGCTWAGLGRITRSSGDFAVRQDQQHSHRGGRLLRVGAYLARHAPVLQVGEAALDPTDVELFQGDARRWHVRLRYRREDATWIRELLRP
ncbi:hypothetical protein H3V39_34150 (plasmid) [Streptomyces sp. M54]|nr:hypothetical protein H3V39_34150 [Streptomyces sp. M54]